LIISSVRFLAASSTWSALSFTEVYH
jgi:hypothetical protein